MDACRLNGYRLNGRRLVGRSGRSDRGNAWLWDGNPWLGQGEPPGCCRMMYSGRLNDCRLGDGSGKSGGSDLSVGIDANVGVDDRID